MEGRMGMEVEVRLCGWKVFIDNDPDRRIMYTYLEAVLRHHGDIADDALAGEVEQWGFAAPVLTATHLFRVAEVVSELAK